MFWASLGHVGTRRRPRGASLAIQVTLPLLAGVGAYVLSAAVVSWLPRVLLVVAGALYLLAVLAVTQFYGISYAVPVGVAGVVALDWHGIPPTHTTTVPDSQNALALAAYLLTAVLLGQLAARVQRRAEASEAARGALAEEQAALRRVATLVARQPSPADVFATVTEEVDRLLSADATSMFRYETDLSATVLASQSDAGVLLPIGARVPVQGDSVITRVYRTGQPARIDDFTAASGTLATQLLGRGVRAAAGCPIVVDGHLWGAMVTASVEAAIPEGTENRIGEFTELVATAIANAEARAALTESRARIVAASDETRRRIERDLHDGVQQRVVSLILDLHAAQALAPAQPAQLHDELDQIAGGLSSTLDELREISHGIHPAILTQGGLKSALKSLSRRSAIPLELDFRSDTRMPEPVEVAMYYAVSEAVTNAAKHAQASVVRVEVATDGAVAELAIRDDGIGGADLGKANGSGLVGLRDRVEALDGRIKVSSPRGEGTSLLISIPTARYGSGPGRRMPDDAGR